MSVVSCITRAVLFGIVSDVLIKDDIMTARYFRRNEGTTDYATIPAASPDRIVMKVIPSAGNGNSGLPTGAPAVTDNVLQTIDFVYSGSISELYRNGSDYFTGTIAGVEMYLSGSLIRDYPLDEPKGTSVIYDLVGGNNGTIVNGNDEDKGLFTKQANGDWLGQELVVNVPASFGTNGTNTVTNITANSFDIDGDGTVFFGVQYGGLLTNGLAYAISGNASLSSGEIKVQSVVNAGFGIINSTGAFSFSGISDGADLVFARNAASQVISASIDNISVKEVLKNA